MLSSSQRAVPSKSPTDIGLFAALLPGLFLLIGCDRMSPATSMSGTLAVVEPATSVVKPRTVWDCGVVLPGEVTRVAFPLDLPDVSSVADISHVKTSCECTEVSLREMHVRGEGIVVACIIIYGSDRNQQRARSSIARFCVYRHD